MDSSAHFSICIGRQLASGGGAIGRLLADRFSARYYDKEILAAAAHASGFAPEVFERSDERKGFFATAIRSISPFGQTGDYTSGPLSDEALFNFQCEGIRRAAQQEPCVFIGRLADYVLRDAPRMVSVFLTADEGERAARIMQQRGCDRDAAKHILEKVDNRRAAFYKFYSGRTWGQASTYDLCLNTSRLGIEGTADFIARYVENRLKLSEQNG